MNLDKISALMLIVSALFSVMSVGCSDNTRDSIKEDMNDAARKVDNAVEDAAD